MFNTNSKVKNIILSSTFGIVEQIVSYVITFVFQTVFLMVLSKNYLGISGLFSNILQIFSLAELGIGGVISFRLYEPIKNRDVNKCGALLSFYKKMYHSLFWIVVLMGAFFYPFIDSIIKDASEIPEDINLKLIYILFVIQSASSYLCVYMQSLLSSDQKGYIVSLVSMIFKIIISAGKIIVLVLTRNYTLTLIIGIILNFILNLIFNIYIKRNYREIVDSKQVITKEERGNIFKDTRALFCHKIGYTVVKGTDSIILSKYIGVVVIGIYSNYVLITTAVDAVLNKLFGSFVSTIANMSLTKNSEERYGVYKKLFFANLWVSSLFTITMFVVINPFIEVWLDKSYLLSIVAVCMISFNLFCGSSRVINTSFINANGLFVKDKFRPVVEAGLNLVLSIILVNKVGLVGVILGTVLSTLLTVWWREPVILYKYVFERNVKEYFIYYMKWMILGIMTSAFFYFLCLKIPVSLIGIVIRLFICLAGINVIYILIFRKTDNYLFYKKLIIKKFIEVFKVGNK